VGLICKIFADIAALCLKKMLSQPWIVSGAEREGLLKEDTGCMALCSKGSFITGFCAAIDDREVIISGAGSFAGLVCLNPFQVKVYPEK
jgi:hypothetical protein